MGDHGAAGGRVVDVRARVHRTGRSRPCDRRAERVRGGRGCHPGRPRHGPAAARADARLPRRRPAIGPRDVVSSQPAGPRRPPRAVAGYRGARRRWPPHRAAYRAAARDALGARARWPDRPARDRRHLVPRGRARVLGRLHAAVRAGVPTRRSMGRHDLPDRRLRTLGPALPRAAGAHARDRPRGVLRAAHADRDAR